MHLLPLADGTLYPLTAVGVFSINRLQLNRPPLIAHRYQQQERMEERQLLEQLRSLLALLEQLTDQQATLRAEQQVLLQRQQSLLRALLDESEWSVDGDQSQNFGCIVACTGSAPRRKAKSQPSGAWLTCSR